MKPIILTFLDADDMNSADLFSKLQEEGFDYQQLSNQEQPPAQLDGVPFAAVLVFSHFDPYRAGKALRMTCDYLKERGGNPEHVIFCGLDLPSGDEGRLRKWGANKIVQPESWEARAVADRVLAALFGGFGTLQGDAEINKGEKPYMECWVPFKATSAKRKIIGATKIMRELFADIEFYSRLSDPILIRGETGTGKELVAAAIHSPNKLSKSKYITINIAEITPSLLPNELFGHSGGAFTDAREERLGLLAQAGDGTVFIDEIGDLEKDNQARLLRVLSNLEIRPVGAKHEKRVPLNARLIFATHQPLEEKCAKDEFRHDLYRRITEGHTIRLRPLRERKGDLELLAKEFFREWSDARNEQHKGLVTLQQSDYDKIVDLCIKHEFPGNVGGLRGILRGCFNSSLKERLFDIARLKLELEIDIERKSMGSVSGSVKEIRRAANMSFVTFDPSADSLEDFKQRALTEYCTEVFRAAGKKIDRAVEVAKKSKKTFYNYLPKVEHKRKQRPGGLESDLPPPD